MARSTKRNRWLAAQESRDTLQRGLKYWVAQWQCTLFWATLANFLQDALDITAKPIVSEPEVMLTMAHLAAAAKENEENPVDWKRTVSMVAKSNPTCVGQLLELSEYVQKYTGGVAGDLLV